MGSLVVRFLAVILLAWLQFLPTSYAQNTATYASAMSSKFVAFPGLPTCVKGSVQNGDPAKGSSVILAKATAACAIPWHWHTANEQLMMVAGRAKVEMKNAAPVTLRAGDYLSLPGKHVHQFTCGSACEFFVVSNAAFDIHYVDSGGKEIQLSEALGSKPGAAKQ